MLFEASRKVIVANELNGFGEIVITGLLSELTVLIVVNGQTAGIVVVMEEVVHAPVVRSAFPFKTTPVLIAPNAPLLQMMVPQKIE